MSSFHTFSELQNQHLYWTSRGRLRSTTTPSRNLAAHSWANSLLSIHLGVSSDGGSALNGPTTRRLRARAADANTQQWTFVKGCIHFFFKTAYGSFIR